MGQQQDAIYLIFIFLTFVVFSHRATAQKWFSTQKNFQQTRAQDILDAQTRHEALNEISLDPHQVIIAPFSLQMAASEDELRAIKMTRELRAQGHDAFYYPNFISKKIIYKVCIARFKTEIQALQALAEMKSREARVISLASRPGSDKIATRSMLEMAELDKNRAALNMVRQPASNHE